MQVTLTSEAQSAMVDLMRRAKGKKIEYGMLLLLEGNNILPGEWKRGGIERILSLPYGIGWFHTHSRWDPLQDRTYEIMRWPKPEPEPPNLSQVDFAHIFVSPSHKIIGVGTPNYSETTVHFATLKKSVPAPMKAEILGIMPLIAITGAPIIGVEDYANLYYFELSSKSLSMEIVT